MSCNAAGRGRREVAALIRFSYCGCFSTPPSLCDTSPIFCCAKHPVMLRDTAGEEEIAHKVPKG